MPDPTSAVDPERDSTEVIADRDQDFRDAPELGTDDDEGARRLPTRRDDTEDLED
ncbi:hypothetical protein JL107_07605 [Nakamurella flavida]|uniref:Uncharacterized protein n=1 Tax=Nakamurella flavida TaxID=363630 RepID=A0A938YI14_9ACTN|nr:hypothetical protein [Nakamurella flavida]MBM9476302.1 hypothetical protein [Nakamurella flavida]MDP9779598.1 hypothetical protein [Nakamurella flavida]